LDLTSLAIFAFALLLNAGSPGPSIAALVGRVLSRGWRDVAPFVAAMWLGEVFWLTLAIAGLAALAETFHQVFAVIKYLGVAYLLYLAWRMWFAPVETPGSGAELPKSSALSMFFGGLTVTLGNPKIMVFYLALLPTIINVSAVAVAEWAVLSLTMLVVLMSIDAGYITLAARTRALLTSPRSMRIANRAGAAAMAGAAATIAARQ
jgi:threonine/homoserine/homoserine lactone efflux protein